MAERKGFLALIMQVFVLLLVLASFGLLIATLVTTLNVQKQQKQQNTATGGTIYNETIYVYNQTIYLNNNTDNNLQVELNVPPPQPIQPGQTQYTSYQSVVQMLKQGLNTQVDPCDDFYTYTCGAFNQQIGFYSSDMDNYNKMVQQMTNQNYVNSAPSPVKQTVSYFNKCKDARANWDTLVANGTQVKNAISTIMAGDSTPGTTNLPFPMLDQTSNVAAFPNKFGLGYLFSKPEGEWGVTSLVSSFVDTNWIDPQGAQGYAMFIDQPTTFVPYTYYMKTWTSTRTSLVNEVIATMNTYAFSQNIALNQTKLTADANDLVDFDYKLATQFSTDDTTRRQFARSYNPMTISQLNAAYPNISWHEYIPTAMLYSGDAMQILANSNYTYIVMEPQQLQKLHDALVLGNTYGITPNLVLNYVYYSTVRSMSDYLPWNAANPSGLESITKMRAEIPQKKLGKKRRNSVVPEKRRFERKQMDDADQISVSCAAETMEMMQYANARIFIDNLYPTQDSRTAIRNNVAKVASSILIGFRSLVDQLDWMSVYSKKGGYSKIENLVKNIAYPDWIVDDALLTTYYSSLGITDQDDYFTMVNKATLFNMDTMWNNLVVGTAANRVDFNGPPGTTNAWYQPELNSITFPAGILHQPFYDVNWPASVNFGAMGVIAGHELTHGFDDEGVQWDGQGTLQGWMDAQSLSSFTDMANCVVNEYSNFCPLNASVYGQGACIDGAQTQGENIADNGGIHAAFRAYKNYINLNGPDPLLPDGMLQGFTADQLFFLGFAQVWCQQPPSDAALARQILVDPHSPSLYRVWGTIQNFPAFKDAFHCPVSNYAPEKHCNVWVSDISSSYGLPQKDPNSLNIRTAQQAKKGQPQYNNYQSVIQLFKQGMNSSADPCGDFYGYTCGAWNSPDMSFDISDNDNFAKMAQQMLNQAYVKSSPNPVKQVVNYFNQCVLAQQNWDTLVANGTQAATAIQALMNGDPTEDGVRQNDTKTTWPMYDQTKNNVMLPGNVTMGFLLGYPGGTYGVATLVSGYVDTNWVDPQGRQGYSYYIDQPSTLLPNTYYRKAWATYQSRLLATVISTMNTYAKSQGKTLDQGRLQQDASNLVNFDYLLAMNFSTDETTRRNSARSYNPITIDQLQARYPFMLWHEFIPLTMLPASDSQHATLHNSSYNFILMEPGMLQKLNDAILDPNNVYKITPEIVLNYIYYAQLNGQAQFLPFSLKNKEHRDIFDLHKEIARPLPGKRRRDQGVVPHKRKWEKRQMDDVTDAQLNCAAETMEMLQYANARVFIDNIYPDQSTRDSIRNNVAKVASSILIGFRSMIDQLNWMTPFTKKGAYNKIEQLVKNIAYPDFITDDAQLTAYHATLNILDGDDYFTVYQKAVTFNLYQQWELLSINGSATRTDFNGPPGTTNAWYQPELNSITFPAAILRQPFYDVSWPASVNFGAMGVIAGHELTHGFDDEGVQWDGQGTLQGWMDNSSQVSFNSMAGCVVDEYSNFCPLDKAAYGSGACLDGAQTQGENIADNGGIHAAFRAYKNYINLNGPDPQLPDGIMEGFTADQLFFLAFAQVWCQMPPSDASVSRQILVDPHSPSLYRVWGTIQNFPAFKDAFHCPASSYAPDQHCNVWVSDISSSYGLPDVKQSDVNVAPRSQAKQTDPDVYSAYQQSVDYFQASVNLSADPCNDFWSYSCGNYHKLVSFHLADAANLVLMAQQLTDPNYQQTIAQSTALTKEQMFFNACVNVTTDAAVNNNSLVSQDIMKQKMADLQAALGVGFTAVTGGSVTTLPGADAMAKALGYLSFQQGIDTYVTPMVDTQWEDNTKGYQFFVDQNSAEKSKTYYAPSAWNITRPDYIKSTVAVFQTYCIEQNIPYTVDNLTATVSALVDFEQAIAYGYSTDDTTRRQYKRSLNPMSAADMNTAYTFVNWNTYIQQMPTVAVPIVSDAAYKIVVMEPDMTTRLSTDLQNGTLFPPDRVVNYLYMRLLLDNAQYLPTYQAALKDFPVHEGGDVLLGKKRRRKVPRRRLADVSAVQSSCISMANDLMQFANGRVFIDYLYPQQSDRDFIRTKAGGVITNIINSFQGMLMSLDWMDTGDKTNALRKTLGIQQNIAFPDWIANDATLDAYYSQLVFNQATDNYYTMWDKLTKFNLYLQYNQLTAKETDRQDFLGQPGTVNAWYQPELNSITFPAGILRPPYYNALWPASINYGGLGVVAGHELTHGFDDEGVQWGPTGNLGTWMKNQTGFNNMANCVVDEYSKFCPLDPQKYSPHCINGAQTQGENIADNGGIHSAFRAYRTHIQLDGPDPNLPDPFFSQFTHDQLFFLSFGQVWCEQYRGDDGEYRQLMTDPHSPSKYRVFGTIQNYPAFQTAFNCPAGSCYAPSDHCRVWVPNIEN